MENFIFNAKKNFKLNRDTELKALGGDMDLNVLALKDGFYISSEGKQVGQIALKDDKAIVTVANADSLVVKKVGSNYVVENKMLTPEEKNDIAYKDKGRYRPSTYIIHGNVKGYNYIIFEKSGKLPETAVQVIPDYAEEEYFRFRIVGGTNVLKLVLIIISLDSLA